MFRWLSRLGTGTRTSARRALLSEIPATPASHPLHTTFATQYRDMERAVAAGDRDALLTHFATGFVNEAIDGHLSGREAVVDAALALNLNRTKHTEETTITKITHTGNEATVEHRYQLTMLERHGHLPDALWSAARDVWHQIDGRWQLTRTEMNAMEMVKDGKRSFRTRLNPLDSTAHVELRDDDTRGTARAVQP
jgi:Domain of unknown function (DUF4440)